MSSVWAFVERMVPRGGTAFVMLLLATVVPPAEVGVYTLSMMLVMLVQTMTDGSVRGVAISAVPSRKGRRFIAKYQWWVSWAGTAIIALGLVGIWFFLSPDLRPVIWGVTPLLLMPASTAMRVRAIADLQLHGSWQSLARHQSMATFVSLAVSIPMLYLTHSIVASSIQAVLTEVFFTWAVVRAVKRVKVQVTDEQLQESLRRRPKPELAHMSGYQLLGWFQSQTDRFLVSIFAGPAVLGQWSFAQNIARSAGDSLAVSTTNVLRPAIFSGDEHTQRVVGQKLLDRALVMTLVIETCVVVIALTVLPLMLSSEWDPAINAVPLMALSCVVTTLNWPLSVYLLKADRIAMASPLKVVGVILALPIALTAVHNFQLAAWLLVVRELVECVLLLALTRKVVPWPAVLRFLGAVAVGAIAILIFQQVRV